MTPTAAPAVQSLTKRDTARGRFIPSELRKTVQDAFGGAESEQEAILLNRLRLLKVPAFVTQAMLIEGRKFRYDVCFPEFRVCVELSGAVWTQGKHTRGAGYEADCVKSALAQIAGWIVIACTPGQVESGVAGHLILEALKARGWRRL